MFVPQWWGCVRGHRHEVGAGTLPSLAERRQVLGPRHQALTVSQPFGIRQQRSALLLLGILPLTARP